MNSVPPFTSDNPACFHCGDVMYDNSLFFAQLADSKSTIMDQNQLETGEFILGTIHRDNNTDDPARLTAIFEALNDISKGENLDVFLPLHPRTSKLLEKNLSGNLLNEISENPHFKISPPVSFLDIIKLEKNARLIMTDSGGVQKESYFFEKPCIILRPETEWVELVENGTAIITDADKERILDAFSFFAENKTLSFPPVFGDGKAGIFICQQIIRAFDGV
jgi:UDP-GlcNAc3NAcA epimerase